MKLDLPPRDILIARMQAWAYENVTHGNYPRATAIAKDCLQRYDNMIAHNPTDSEGYWSGFYYVQFCTKCKDAKL